MHLVNPTLTLDPQPSTPNPLTLARSGAASCRMTLHDGAAGAGADAAASSAAAGSSATPMGAVVGAAETSVATGEPEVSVGMEPGLSHSVKTSVTAPNSPTPCHQHSVANTL